MQADIHLSLTEGAVRVLSMSDPMAKVRLGRQVAAAWRKGCLVDVGDHLPPDRPGRPDRPTLSSPRDVPKRKVSGRPGGRIALLHALAHIELNAIDLAWDMIARFAPLRLPRNFLDDWVGVADQESLHFTLLSDRLTVMGMSYGDLPAHDGLWEAARSTAHDILARLAIVPLVLEARGLDVAPAMIERLLAVGDAESAHVLKVIYRDEISHVAIGKRWFDDLIAARGGDPVKTWQGLVRRYFEGGVKPPFNIPAREAAGFSAAFYGPLGEEFLLRRRKG
ncbi:MAG: rhamnosyltransferase [Rhodospirillaceae bacterium]|nr:rhamnosyltransferase [Rhodospirillaceae bacterium]